MTPYIITRIRRVVLGCWGAALNAWSASFAAMGCCHGRYSKAHARSLSSCSDWKILTLLVSIFNVVQYCPPHLQSSSNEPTRYTQAQDLFQIGCSQRERKQTHAQVHSRQNSPEACSLQSRRIQHLSPMQQRLI